MKLSRATIRRVSTTTESPITSVSQFLRDHFPLKLVELGVYSAVAKHTQLIFENLPTPYFSFFVGIQRVMAGGREM